MRTSTPDSVSPMAQAPEPHGPGQPIYQRAPSYYGAPSSDSPYYASVSEELGPLGSLTPLRLLNILRKKWLTILLVVAFVVCGAAFYLSRVVRLYQADALVELSVRRPRLLNQQAAVIEDPAASFQLEEALNTQLEKFKSSTMMPSVIACYRQRNPADKTPDAALSLRLRGGVSFALIRRTRLVAISFVDDNPEFAAKACTAYAEGTEAHARAENRTASDAAVAWLEAQAKSQQQELEAADRALFDASQTSKIETLRSQRKTIEDALLDFNRALVGVESDAAKQRELLAALSEVELKPENAGKLPAAIPHAVEVQQALDRWLAAVTDRDSLLSKYTPMHPEVVAREQMVTLYRDQALAALERAKTTAASDLGLLKNQAVSLRQKKDEQSKLSADLERDILDREMKLSALERTRSAADASYQGVLKRIQEARLAADENTASIKLVEEPGVPQVPVSPRVPRVILIALLMGLIGGVSLALITDTLEDHVVSSADIEVLSGIRILAVVPHVDAKARKEIATASITRKFGQVAEAFAGLRSVLDSALYREQTRVILIASSVPEEGKTTTSCNLAAVCARNGQKTLLIDFDMRRPRIAGIFPMPPGRRGLLDYLANSDEGFDGMVYETDYANLSVIASRPVKDASPAELVGGKKVEDLLLWAREHFDRVIIDAPPLGLVSDALVLAGLADCVLIMARPGTSRKRAIRHTVQRCRDVGVRMIAAVMNDLDLTKSIHHGYGPYYHYTQHYHAYHQPPPGAGKEA